MSVHGARETIAQAKVLRALTRLRSRDRGNLDALAQAIAVTFATGTSPRGVAGVEVDPLMVRREGEGVMAVDALVRRVD